MKKHFEIYLRKIKMLEKVIRNERMTFSFQRTMFSVYVTLALVLTGIAFFMLSLFEKIGFLDLTSFILLILVYLMPSMLAFDVFSAYQDKFDIPKLQHPKKMLIIFINLFFGWTILGWVFALFIACKLGEVNVKRVIYGEHERNDEETVLPTEKSNQASENNIPVSEKKASVSEKSSALTLVDKKVSLPIESATKSKNCLFCGEIVLEKATKCKHCGEFFDDPSSRQQAVSHLTSQTVVVKNKGCGGCSGCLIATIVGVIILVVLGSCALKTVY